jgi:L-ribulose-5-phosphate 3-epimerase UlaE
MKTAMQELTDWISVNDITLKVSLYNNELINKINNLLEKEKEQIVNAHGLKYYDIGEVTITGEEYYNQTYKPETI